MRIHAPPQRRVAGHAVPLRMAGGATLKSLACRSPVLQQPLRLRRVERGVETSLGRQPAFTVTAPAEQFRVMAGRALVFAAVRIRRVPLDEIRGVEASAPAACVAIGTESLFVTTGARWCARRRSRAVLRTEQGIVDSNRSRLPGTRVLTNQRKRNHRHARTCRLQAEKH